MARLLMGTLLVVSLGVSGQAEEGPPPPAGLKPPPKISHACLLKAGPKQNTSFFHSKEAEYIIGSWGVVTGAHRQQTLTSDHSLIQLLRSSCGSTLGADRCAGIRFPACRDG